MKKLTTLLLAVGLISFSAHAQYYIVSNTNAGMNPGNLNLDAEYPVGGGLPAGWTTIFTGSVNTSTTPSYTANQTIPFPFQFNGSAVTSYKVSTNGILTFDVAATANPTATNATIPSTSLPNNSIGIWGLFAQAGDYIVTKTFGTAPNRQHWVFFSSYSTAGAGWSYWSIVLEETSNKLYVVDQRTNTGPNTLTIGLQINSTTGFQVAGSPNITSLTVNDPTPVDNSYYEFIPGTQPANDASLEALSLPNPVSGANPIVIGGTIKNLGTATLTSVVVNWSVVGNATVNMDTISMNLATNSQVGFVHSINWTPATLGQFYDIEVWTSNPNGVADGNTANDTIAENVFVNLGNTVTRNVLMEEFTTAVCQFCPDGHVVQDQIVASIPTVIPVGVHACFNTDAMTVPEASTLCSVLGINSAPTAMVDRKLYPGNTDVAFGRGGNAWGIACSTQTAAGSPVDITLNGTYNPTTRLLNLDVNSSFVDYALPGDIRVSLLVLQDSMSGTGNGWAQYNAYYAVNGHPFFGVGTPFAPPNNTISYINNYQHMHVLRDIFPSTWGDNTVIPANYQLNTTYTKNYNQGVATNINDDQAYLVAVVSYYGANNIGEYEVLNAKKIKLKSLATTLNEESELSNSFKIYPNPTDLPYANVEFKLKENSFVQARISDITGKVVSTEDFGVMSQGNQMVRLNTAHLENGFYIVNLKVGDEEISSKISILK